MDVFTSAAELLRDRRPGASSPGLEAACRAPRGEWFLANFPGRVLYAAKANDASKSSSTRWSKAGVAGLRRRLAGRDRARGAHPRMPSSTS